MNRLVLPLLLVAVTTRAETVVVLPFVAADEELGIYGKLVADAVAKVLNDTYKVKALVVGSGQPPKSDLVVELRAARDRKGVRLEAWLRNPDAGERKGPPITTDRTPLAQLDRAAVDLGHRVGVRLAALDPPKKKRAPAATPAPPPAPPPAPDSRPAIVLYKPSGESIGQAPAAAAAAATQLLDQLGFRVIASERSGWVSPEISAGDAASAKARATMIVHIRKLDFDWNGVLTGRAMVQIIVVSADRKIVFDRELQTDTVVGGRADGHPAVAQYAIRQAIEMSRRDLSAALGSH